MRVPLIVVVTEERPIVNADAFAVPMDIVPAVPVAVPASTDIFPEVDVVPVEFPVPSVSEPDAYDVVLVAPVLIVIDSLMEIGLFTGVTKLIAPVPVPNLVGSSVDEDVRYVLVSNDHVFAAVFLRRPEVPVNAAIAVRSASNG